MSKIFFFTAMGCATIVGTGVAIVTALYFIFQAYLENFKKEIKAEIQALKTEFKMDIQKVSYDFNRVGADLKSSIDHSQEHANFQDQKR